jgi:hypothetical protein
MRFKWFKTFLSRKGELDGSGNGFPVWIKYLRTSWRGNDRDFGSSIYGKNFTGNEHREHVAKNGRACGRLRLEMTAQTLSCVCSCSEPVTVCQTSEAERERADSQNDMKQADWPQRPSTSMTLPA